MKLNDMQLAALTISLSTLGQVDITDNDPEALGTLEYLLEEALKNVRKAVAAQASTSDDDRSGWLNMSNGEEVP
jgi:hypothetical protein